MLHPLLQLDVKVCADCLRSLESLGPAQLDERAVHISQATPAQRHAWRHIYGGAWLCRDCFETRFPREWKRVAPLLPRERE